MKRLSRLVVGLLALAFAGAVPASTVTILVDTELAPDKQFSVKFDTGFGFFDSGYPKTGDIPNVADYTFTDLDLSNEEATGWAGVGTKASEEVAFLDRMLTELKLPTASDIYFEKIDVETNTFTTNREFFWIKVGQWTAYFQNTNLGSETTVLFLDKDGKAVDFSHYGVAGVPIPAAFVLFGSGLVGLGWLARRQRARKEESVV